MKRFLLLIFTIWMVSCVVEEEEPEVIISGIDGDEYMIDMTGEMTSKKAAHLVLEGKIEEVDFTFKRIISDSLVTEDSIWRIKYFEALNKLAPQLDSLDMEYIGSNVFSYFLHHPIELINQFEEVAFDNSDIWLIVLSDQFAMRTSPDDISINSVINLAHKYCAECSDAQKELIIEFVKMLALYEE